MQNLYFILAPFLYVEILGLLAFPLCHRIFNGAKDGGYLYSKTAGVILFGYLSFIFLASGAGKILYLNFVAPPLILLILGICFASRDIERLKDYFRKNLKFILAAESAFLCLFLILIFIKSGAPDLLGSEKIPDFALYNRLTIESEFPPKDVWMSGYPVNYYYFSHLAWAALTKTAFVPASYGVNVSVALVLALIFSTAFSIAYNLTGRFANGLLSGIAVSLLGNLDGAVQILKNGFKRFDWWKSSRVLEGTINEFPYFSFLNGDLHAHYSSLPFYLFSVGLILHIMNSGKSPLKKPFGKISLNEGAVFIIAGITLSAVLMSNPWYFPTLPPILLFSCLSLKDWGQSMPDRFFRSLFYTFAVAFSAAVFSLPFLLTYKSPAQGIGIVPYGLMSKTDEFLVMYFFPLLFLTFYIYRSAKNLSFCKGDIFYSLFLLLPLATIIVRPAPAAFFLALYLAAAFALYIKTDFKDSVLLLSVAILTALLGCEYFYLKDNYAYENARMNTVFKFHYIVFALSLAVVPIYYFKVSDTLSKLFYRKALTVLFAVLFCSSAAFLFMGTYVKNFGSKTPFMKDLSLDSFRFLKSHDPGLLGAAVWIKDNTRKNDVIAEASGKPYGLYSLLSAITGRPAVLGWANHELVWRPFDYPQIARRLEDIDQIFTAKTKESAKSAASKYGVKYIVAGRMEKYKYSKTNLENLGKFFPVAFAHADITVYAVH